LAKPLWSRGSGFRVAVQGSGFMVQGSGLGFRVQGSCGEGFTVAFTTSACNRRRCHQPPRRTGAPSTSQRITPPRCRRRRERRRRRGDGDGERHVCVHLRQLLHNIIFRFLPRHKKQINGAHPSPRYNNNAEIFGHNTSWLKSYLVTVPFGQNTIWPKDKSFNLVNREKMVPFFRE